MKIFLSLMVLFLAVANVSAQKFMKKPYSEWKKGDVEKLTTDSGWAKSYMSTASAASADMQAVNRSVRDTANSGGGNPGSVSRNMGNLPVVIRLHSALPIRQATVRGQQIAVGYDKMDPAEKAEFDASRKVFLDCAICKDYYVITLTQFRDSSGESVNEGIFQALTLEDLKGHLTLVNDQGEQRELAQFTPSKGAGDSSIFFFKRLDENGKPFLTAESKGFEFVFTNVFIEKEKRYAGLFPRRFEFSVSKMLVDGELMF